MQEYPGIMFEPNLSLSEPSSSPPTAISAGKLTHGHARSGRISREYRSWQMMVQRCTNPKRTGYPNYGGRGIKVCERWLYSFASFRDRKVAI